MNRETARFEALLLERLGSIRQEKLEVIGAGVTPDEYKHWTGYIRCLKDVKDIVAAVRKKFEQE
jgi:hypothetical protein